jgi:hypothetical protein
VRFSWGESRHFDWVDGAWLCAIYARTARVAHSPGYCEAVPDCNTFDSSRPRLWLLAHCGTTPGLSTHLSIENESSRQIRFARGSLARYKPSARPAAPAIPALPCSRTLARYRFVVIVEADHSNVFRDPLAALADALRRLIDAKIPLEGASDHGISEALYLSDPDGNGVELYWDRPQEQWQRDAKGGLAMFTRRLDWRIYCAKCRFKASAALSSFTDNPPPVSYASRRLAGHRQRQWNCDKRKEHGEHNLFESSKWRGYEFWEQGEPPTDAGRSGPARESECRNWADDHRPL